MTSTATLARILIASNLLWMYAGVVRLKKAYREWRRDKGYDPYNSSSY